VLIALVLTALVFIAPVLWILEAVPVPLQARWTYCQPIYYCWLSLQFVSIIIKDHTRLRAEASSQLAVAELEYGQLAIEKKPKKVPLTLNRWRTPGRLIWLVFRAVGGGAID